jgi:hypothetical protein
VQCFLVGPVLYILVCGMKLYTWRWQIPLVLPSLCGIAIIMWMPNVVVTHCAHCVWPPSVLYTGLMGSWDAQEVVGSDMSALQSVVAADMELTALREEEAAITARLGDINLEDGAGPSGQEADDEADSDRLNEIYERMQVCF